MNCGVSGNDYFLKKKKRLIVHFYNSYTIFTNSCIIRFLMEPQTNSDVEKILISEAGTYETTEVHY